MSVYIKLFHGRRDPAQEMDDWGERGPILGPFRWVHTTYGRDIHIGGECPPWDSVGDLHVRDGMVHYDGIWYGDWSVFDETVLDQMSREEKARVIAYDERLSCPAAT